MKSVILLLCVIVLSANALSVYRFHSGFGLDSYTSYQGDVSEDYREDCPSGSCIAVSNDQSGNNPMVNGNVIALFDTSGATDCVLNFYVHTTSLETDDSCGLWITHDSGNEWVQYWNHHGPGEISEWPLVTIQGGGGFFENNTQTGFKFGPYDTNGKRDFCWIDQAEVICQI